MSGEVFLMGNSSVTKAAGVIRVSYPANSTLVVKGTSSGKQFAKDTNTTSSAKAYIFLAPIGDASYTLTTTNTAGKTVSKQVYVAKDQVQSVVLAYELILFDGGDNIGVTGGWTYTITKDDYYGGPSAREDNLTVGTTLYWLPGRSWNSEGTDQKNKNGYAHTKNKIDVTNYNTITAVSNYAQGHLTVGNASVALKVGTVSLDISALTESYEVRLGDTASGDACSKVEISKLYLS